MPIPKIIHQTYKSYETIPDRWKNVPDHWKALHPNWEYRFWSDDDLRNLIKDYYWWFLAKYDSYPYTIQRVDAARYFILHRYGGVYADLDIYPIESLDQWIDEINVEAAFVASGNVSTCLTNSFMASVPGASIWPLVHVELSSVKCKRWWAWTKHFIVMTTTGPMMLDRVVRKQATRTVALLPQKRFHDVCGKSSSHHVLNHVQGKSWENWDSKAFMYCWKHSTFLIVLVTLFAVIFVAAFVIMINRYGNISKLAKFYQYQSECISRTLRGMMQYRL